MQNRSSTNASLLEQEKTIVHAEAKDTNSSFSSPAPPLLPNHTPPLPKPSTRPSSRGSGRFWGSENTFVSPVGSYEGASVGRSMTLATLLKQGFSPTINSVNQLLLYLSRAKRSKGIIFLFTQLNRNQIKGNFVTRSIVSWALLNCHEFEEAWDLMRTHAAKYPSSRRRRMLDSLIQGFCVERDDPDKALVILRSCVASLAVLPSSFSFSSLIHCFVSRGDMSKAMEVLELMTGETVKYPSDNFVCSAVISGFCRIGQPELALGFFENASSSGALKPNVVTYTALVSALCKSGKFEEVRSLVCRMENRGLVFDAVLYTNLIYGNLLRGLLIEAFQKHRIMLERGINPDIVSYTALIDGLSKEGYVEKAVGFLEKMIKDGIEPNLVTYTSIMRGYCRKGRVEEAFTLFEKVLDLGIKVDEFMCVTLIDGYCRKGDLDRVFQILGKMEKIGVKPSIITYNTVINGLCKSGKTCDGDVVSKGILSDVVTYCTLLDGYSKERNFEGVLETKRRFEEAGICMDAVMCNVLLKALLLVGAFQDAYSLYKASPLMGLVRDSTTYYTMIKGYCKAGRIEEALEVFDDFRRTSVSSVACYSCIINGLSRKGMLETAVEVFIELCEKGVSLDHSVYKKSLDAILLGGGSEGVLNLVYRLENTNFDFYDVICDIAIYLLCKGGALEAAIEVYMVMKRNGFAVASKSYSSMLKCTFAGGINSCFIPLINIYLKAYGLVEPMVCNIILVNLCLKNIDIALQFLKGMVGAKFSLTLLPMVLKKLAKDGRSLDAYTLVIEGQDNLPSLDTIDYSIIIDALCRGGYIVKALDLCAFAKSKGVSLNIVTYNSVIDGLCRQGCLVEACRLFDSLGSIGLVPSKVTYGILIDNLCKEGFLSDAKILFDQMILKGLEVNIRIYNSMINGYCRLGKITEALDLLLDMETECIKPDEFTVSTVIKGCCLIGDLEKAHIFLFKFKKKDVFPDFLGYLYMITGFCAKGRIEEAQTVLREMLQSDSVSEIINKVDSEVESEPIRGFLVDLCERGSIQGAVAVLNEIGSFFFPLPKRINANNLSPFSKKLYENGASTQDLSVSCVKKQQLLAEHADNMQREPEFGDFASCYSVISSLCLKGELEQANQMVKAMLSSMPK